MSLILELTPSGKEIAREMTPIEIIAYGMNLIDEDRVLWTYAEKEAYYRKQRNNTIEKTTKKKSVSEPPEKLLYQTSFTETDLLEEALKQSDVKYKKSKGNIAFDISGYTIEMKNGEDDIYQLLAIGNGNKKEIEAFYEKLLGKYEQLLQKKVCDNVKEKIKNTSMQLDQEEILEDNSILLTISI